MTERSTDHERQTPELTEAQLASLQDFIASQAPSSVREGATIDQAAATVRDQLELLGLKIKTDAQFFVACVVAVTTAENMRDLLEAGGKHRKCRSVCMQNHCCSAPASE